ncbi:MAG: DNA polymerase III subunit alpha [candidate division KSB1 bacterium]|nr:DNA polymerase III subunit alpha [candidate division KSB1 bacterium]
MVEFVHLHNHSHYSLLDGACRIEDLVAQCAHFEMPALALTDHGNMFGAVEFYRAALNAGIKPIIGIEAYVAPRSRHDRTSSKGGADASFHIVLLAKNEKGYRNLLKLSTIGYLEGYYYRPRIDKEVLREYADGLVALSACIKGEIAQRLLREGPDAARRAALEYRDIFGEDFYLELQNHGLAEEEKIRAAILELGRSLGIKVVATNDIHYLKREHAEAHDVLLCLQTQKDRNDPTRLRYETDQIYFKSYDEMRAAFRDVPEALANTMEVAAKCNLILEFGRPLLPQYQLPPDASSSSLDDYLAALAREGLRQRYAVITRELERRLEHELEIIRKTGYAGYFLIVKDFVDFARSNGIPVGPGRGSAAGSLVSYCLGITNVDPIKYGLLFERFLNPERVTMPDIDIDFCYERRDEVIQYVRKKYGHENVAQIITFGTMAARAVVRDVGRVLGFPYAEVDRVAKLVPQALGIKLREAIDQEPRLRELMDSNERYRKLFEISLVLEGLARHASTHAAGVVITPNALTNYTPLYKSKEGEITTQYDMKSLEAIGLLKMDFLGLRTLTVIHDTVKALGEKGIHVDIDRLPLDDEETYELFGRGDTVAVFQFESSGMREYLRKLKPRTIEDLIAMNALYRPGPMEMIDDFILRKQGKTRIEYLHPKLEPILKETYGVIVYQEQVMRIASDLAGFSLGKADLLRRAMGKKKAELMVSQRQEFVDGAVQRGIPAETAEAIFDLMARFAQYGFNKSHAAAYSIVAYQTAYLKAHFPAEFMAATLTSEMADSKRIVTLIDECRKMGLRVLPPDVNESYTTFTVTDQGIRFGLAAVKNVGVQAINSIVQARKKYGRFRTIFELCQRVDLRYVNKKVLESLIQAGALDSLEGHRAQLMAAVDLALQYGQRVQSARAVAQADLFADDEEAAASVEPRLPDVPEWSHSETLAREKQLLGFYVSGHPLDRYEQEVRAFSTVTLDTLAELPDQAPVRVAGVVTAVSHRMSDNQRAYAFLNLEDFTGSAEVLVFSEPLERYRDLIREEAMILVRGKVSHREDQDAKIIAEEIMPLEQARERLAKRIRLTLDVRAIDEAQVETVCQLLAANSGGCAVVLELKNAGSNDFLLRSARFRVQPNYNLVQALRSLLGTENVLLEG